MTYSNWREELFEGKAKVFTTAFGVARKVFKGRPASINYRVTRGKNFKLVDRYKDVASTIQYPQRSQNPYANFRPDTTKNMTAIPNKVRDSYYTTGRGSFIRQKYNVLDPNQFRAISNVKGKIYRPSDKLLKKDISKIAIARKKGLLQGDDEFKSLVDMRKSEFNKQKELYDKQITKKQLKKYKKDSYKDPKTGIEYDIPEQVAVAALKGGSKLIPALMTGIGAAGTIMQARKKRKIGAMEKRLMDRENNVRDNDMIRARRDEADKQNKLIDKYEKKHKSQNEKNIRKNVMKGLKSGEVIQDEFSAPTNNVGDGKIAGTVEAGDNPPVKKKKRYIYGGKGSRKNWMV